MCGIVGIVHFRNGDSIEPNLLHTMNDHLQHRGPDGFGYHIDGSVGLGHRRLSIIDLSSGDQPMISADRRVCVVFNGEIYNFRELAAELSARGHRFRTQSDTEVLIHAWEEWGTQCVDRFNGMFAFALWDRESRQLFLARDRLGIKPLYYALTKNGKLLFASELKALQAHPDLERQIDERAIVDYFTLGYIPDPRSIYGLVHKLPPGHWMLMDVSNGKHRLSTYWDIQFDVEADDKRSVEELGQELLERLQESVRMQLVADVPLGAFLSGGVDSSAVVAMMAGLITDPVRTCAIAFDDPDFDESEHASSVAALLRADHTERTVRVDDFALMDRLVQVYDEPFADSSAIPTYRLCEVTRQIVKVALSGDGGDENFAGYRRYQLFNAEESLRRILPAAIRQPLFGFLGDIYPKLDWAPRPFRGKTTFQALARDSIGAYLHGVSIASDEVRQLLFSQDFLESTDGYQTLNLFHERVEGKQFPDALSMVQYLDFKTYLPGDILTKVDRASMAHSLEVRVPLLDHEFVNWVAHLPSKLKLRRLQGKYIFKKSLEGTLPDSILYRRKMGFGVPLQRWFRGPLSGRVSDLKHSPALLESGIFDSAGLQHVIDRHLGGQRDYSALIWALLIFESFLTRR